MPNLLVKPSTPGCPGASMRSRRPSAGWTYVGFEVYRLEGRAEPDAGRRATGRPASCCCPARRGSAAGGQDFGMIGGRDVAVRAGPVVALCAGALRLVARRPRRDCEIAVCTAPAEGKLPARVIAPDRSARRPAARAPTPATCATSCPRPSLAESLLVVEVITPAGHWSSYPPHKHDRDDAARTRSLLEETYYHRLNPPAGFALQRVYTDDRSLDETHGGRRTATWCWCRAAITRSARRMATSSIIST